MTKTNASNSSATLLCHTCPGRSPSPLIRCIAVPGASGHPRRLETAVGAAGRAEPEPAARHIFNKINLRKVCFVACGTKREPHQVPGRREPSAGGSALNGSPAAGALCAVKQQNIPLYPMGVRKRVRARPFDGHRQGGVVGHKPVSIYIYIYI